MDDPDTIYNWRRLDDRITTSGHPTEPQLADIHARGVLHVVNLGLHTYEKALPDEVASVRVLGMTYIHIPVDFPESDRPGLRAVLLCHGTAKEGPGTRPLHRELPGCRRFSIDIVAVCSAWTRPRRELKWNRFGTRRASGRHSWTARRREARP